MMQSKLFIKLFAFLLIVHVATPTFGQDKPPDKPAKKLPPKPLSEAELKKMSKNKLRPVQSKGFYLSPIVETPGRYSLLLSDADNRTLAETIYQPALEAMEVVIQEAKKFALNNEAVGVKKPVVTRFTNRAAAMFMVDVEKIGNESRFFVTVKGLAGTLTVEAGTLQRGEPNPSPVFLDDILTRVQAMKAAQTQQQQ